MTRFWRYSTLAMAIALGAAAPVWAASVREKQSFDVWRIQDNCAQAAFLKHPDYTPESNAARDRETRQCEIKNHLPPRAPVIASPVKTIPDADAN